MCNRRPLLCVTAKHSNFLLQAIPHISDLCVLKFLCSCELTMQYHGCSTQHHMQCCSVVQTHSPCTQLLWSGYSGPVHVMSLSLCHGTCHVTISWYSMSLSWCHNLHVTVTMSWYTMSLSLPMSLVYRVVWWLHPTMRTSSAMCATKFGCARMARFTRWRGAWKNTKHSSRL